MSPTAAAVVAGDTHQFTATALDQNGNPLSTQPSSFKWSVTGGGKISSTGLLTARTTTGGPFTVTASASGVSGTSSFTVASTHTVTFGAPISIPVTNQNGAFVADIDGDGHQDIVVNSGSSLVFLYGNGNGTFTQVNYPYSGLNLSYGTAGDLSGNGRMDLVFASGSNIAVIKNLGSRTFAAPVYYPSYAGANAIALGDFNGDGKLDIANACTGPGIGPGPNELAVLLNNGDGTFGAPTTYQVPGNYYGYVRGVVAIDVNSDGNLDLVCSEEDELGTPEGSIFIGDGHGNFALENNGLTTVGGGSLLTADFNNDGIPDIATSDHWAGQPRWGLGNGKGYFPFQSTQGGAGYSGPLTAADFDGDGYIDLAQAYSASTNLLFYPNNGDGTFAEAARYSLSASNPVAADVNEDGQPDLVMTSNSNAIVIYPNTTDPAPTITGEWPDGAAVGATQPLTIYGHGLLSSSVVNWNGTPLPTTFDYHDDSLSTTLTPTQLASAGTATITVTTPAPGGGTSNPVDFFVGNTPTSIKITPSPTAADAGTTRDFVATVYDQNGVPMAVQPKATWKTQGLDNTILPNGIFSAGYAPGVYPVTATYGSLTATADLTVRDFTLSPSPQDVTVAQGSSATTTIDITPIEGFDNIVGLTVTSELPGGVVATFQPGAATTGSLLTFTASPTATTGTATVTVTGAFEGDVHTTAINLTVTGS